MEPRRFNVKAGFYVAAVTCVIMLVGFILYCVSNGVQGYSLSGAGGYITAGVFALVCAVTLLFVAFSAMLSNRIGVASAVLTYDGNNEVAWQAFNTGVVSMIFTFVAEIAVAVGAFFDFGRRD